jgi:hypothetical protein
VRNAVQIHVSLLRALAEDENKVERAKHCLDLGLLDAVTWPDYLWDFLRMVGDPAGRFAAALASSAPPVSHVYASVEVLESQLVHSVEVVVRFKDGARIIYHVSAGPRGRELR